MFLYSFFFIYLFTVWRHVDKTGPEGNIDALMQNGQGDSIITVYLTKIAGALMKADSS